MNMKRRENETREEYIERFNEEFDKSLEAEKAMKDEKKKKRKGFFVSLGVITLGLITTITGIIHTKKYKKYEEPKNKVETLVDDKDLDDLGFEEEKVAENKNDAIYGNTTGDVDKNKVVEKDGTIWKDKEAADKSNQVGKEVVDDKNGTLVVKPDGTVTEKDKDYVVKDETGKEVESGSNETGKPDDYIWDNEENKGLKEGYVYADATYYNSVGKVVVTKGQVILKTTLETIKKTCTTTKPQTNTNNQESTNTTTNNSNNNKTETTITETFTPTEGVVNPNGTYTIDGITFESKADYEQWVIQGYEGYAIDNSDGIMKSIEGKTLVKSR